MKPEMLQAVSLIALIVGLVLSTFGALGTYYFRAKSERAKEQRTEFAGAPRLRKAVVPEKKEPAPEPVQSQEEEQKAAVRVATVSPAEPKPTTSPVESPAPEKPEPAEPTIVATAPSTPTPSPEPHEPAIPESTVPPKASELEPKPKPEPALAAWQTDKLVQRLRGFPNGTIVIRVLEGDDEAGEFAQALKAGFVTAGWKVTGVQPIKATRDRKGITLSSGTFPPPPEVTTVFSALVTAGLKLSTDLDPAQGKQPAVLFVGSKP